MASQHPKEVKEVSQQEVMDEVKAGRMTGAQFRSFVTSEEHRLFGLLFASAVLSIFGTIVFVSIRVFRAAVSSDPDGIEDNLWDNSFCHIMESAVVSVLGLMAATHLAYVAELMKEEIIRMREQNKKLKTQVTSLENTNAGLQDTCKEMGQNVQRFEALQGQLKSQGDQESADFGEIMTKTTQLFDEMKRNNKNQLSTLMKKIAQDCEFIDNEEGLTKEEYEVWVKHVVAPMPLPSFEQITGNKTASFEEVGVAIDESVEKHTW